MPHSIRRTGAAPELGKDKGMEFFKRHGDVFALYGLPGSYCCLVINKSYPTDTEVSLPEQAEILRILDEIRIRGANTHKVGSDNETAPYQNSLR